MNGDNNNYDSRWLGKDTASHINGNLRNGTNTVTMVISIIPQFSIVLQ